MPNRSRKKKPTDPKQMGAFIVQQATTAEPMEPRQKNPHAVALGRLGGLRGGRVRAANLSAKRRREIARKAAVKRWGKK